MVEVTRVIARSAQAIERGAEAEQAGHEGGPVAAAHDSGQPGGPRGVGHDKGARGAGGQEVGDSEPNLRHRGGKPVVFAAAVLRDRERVDPRCFRVEVQGAEAARVWRREGLARVDAGEAIDRVRPSALVEPVE